MVMQRVSNVRSRLAQMIAPPAPPAPVSAGRPAVYYTVGDQLVSPAEYRMNVERHLRSALVSSVNVDDELIARAYSVSATAYACANYRASAGSGIPLHVKAPDGEIIANNPLQYTLKNQTYILFNSIMMCLMFGRCYWVKVRNPHGYPTGLALAHPQDVREEVDELERVYNYKVRIGGAVWDDVSPDNMVYMEVFDPDSSGNGVSKFEASWRNMNVELGVNIHAAAFFVNGARIDGFLSFEQPLTDDQFAKAEYDWKQFQGAARAHKTAVMPAGAKWNSISSDPKDLAMTELKEDERKDICAIFETHPALVGLGDVADQLSANSTFAAVEVQHIRSVAIPFIERVIVSALNRQWAWVDFAPGEYYTLCVDENSIPALTEAQLVKAQTAVDLTTADTPILTYNEARALIGHDPENAYFTRPMGEVLSALESSVLTVNEARALGGVSPVPWGDAVMLDGAPVPVEDVPTFWRKKLGIPDDVPGLMLPPGDASPPGGGTPPAPNDQPPAAPPALSAGLWVAADPDRGLPAVRLPDNHDYQMQQLALEGWEPVPPGPLFLSTQRAFEPLRFRLDFSHSQHVRYCVRTLSTFFSDKGVRVLEWTPESEWAIDLGQVNAWTPADLSRMLRVMDYSDTRKVDLAVTGYETIGDEVHLTLGGDLSALQSAVTHDLTGFQYTPASRMTVPLCVMQSPYTDPLPVPLNYPVVGSAIGIYSGSRLRHSWPLRAASPRQQHDIIAWERTLTRRRPDYLFQSDVLPADISAFIRWALETGHERERVIYEARGQLSETENPRPLWAEWDTVRSIQSTRLDFEGQIESLIAEARARSIDRATFSRRLRTYIRGYGRLAYLNGLRDGGLVMELDELDPTEQREIEALITSQSQFVSKFGDTLFNGAGITDAQARQKPAMWFNMSVMPIYNAGLVSADKNGLREWVLGNTEHCSDCLKLSGQKRRMSFWMSAIMPQDSRLECGGFNCGCRLVPARGQASRGRLPFAVRMIVIDENGKRKAVPLADVEPDSYYEDRGFGGMESGVILLEKDSVRFVSWSDYDLETGEHEHVHIPEGTDFEAAVDILEALGGGDVPPEAE